MRVARLAIVLTVIGLVLCLALLVKVTWYTFIAFMVLAQPLLLLGVVTFVAAVAWQLRRRGTG